MSTTLVYTTARPRPQLNWFFDSLVLNGGCEEIGQIIIIDLFAEPFDDWSELDVAHRRNEVFHAAQKFVNWFKCDVDWQPPKPNVWSGKYRLTPRNWWAKANALNTGLCLTKGDYVVFSDDRCVLAPTFLDAVREARQSNYVVCGTYEKRNGLEVVDGKITNPGEVTGKDSRAAVAQGRKMICPGAWMFGHAFGLPTEWMLEVNGVDESFDSVSMEDTHFGQMVENSGYPIYHDPRMAQIQDRSPEAAAYDMKRSSKEKHSGDKNDKTHKLIERLWGNKRAAHHWNLREIRKLALAGNPFPIPLKPDVDWFDGQPLKEMI